MSTISSIPFSTSAQTTLDALLTNAFPVRYLVSPNDKCNKEYSRVIFEPPQSQVQIHEVKFKRGEGVDDYASRGRRAPCPRTTIGEEMKDLVMICAFTFTASKAVGRRLVTETTKPVQIPSITPDEGLLPVIGGSRH